MTTRPPLTPDLLHRMAEAQQALDAFWATNQPCPQCNNTIQRYACPRCDQTGMVPKPGS